MEIKEVIEGGINIESNKICTKTTEYPMPLISVVLPTHNREYNIEYALRSILKQSYINWEVIIMCDACTDNTLKHVQKFDSRIRTLSSSKRLGSSLSRNIGIKYSRGEILLMLEDDAYLEEHCLEEVVKAIRTGADLVCFNMIDIKDLEKRRKYDPKDWNYLLERKFSRINSHYTPFVWHKWFGVFTEHVGPSKMVEVEVCRGVCYQEKYTRKKGGYDEGYTGNAYHEETDLQLRARNSGFRLVYIPTTFFFHLGFKNKTDGQNTKIYKYELFIIKDLKSFYDFIL
jgi:glycosyltransferase involved in cell wall biosynthesis